MGGHFLPDHNRQILIHALPSQFTVSGKATQTHRTALMASGICWGCPRWRNMMMKRQVITYQRVLMLSCANHYNHALYFAVVSCFRYHLFSEFGILWLLALPTCGLYQHCSRLTWQWQLTVKVLLHCVLLGFRYTHILGQKTVIIIVFTGCL